MIPLAISLKLSFRDVLKMREYEAPADPHKDDLDLRSYELARIERALKDNSPPFPLSRDEISLLFRSYQYKRTHKKKKNPAKQISRYV